VRPQHALRLASTGRFFTRTGNERRKLADGRDPLASRKNLFTLTTGVEYELNAFTMRAAEERAATPSDPSRTHRLQNVILVKHYLWAASADRVQSGSVLKSLDFARQRFGIGDGMRFRITEWLYAKVSYEFATRLPSVDEIYGNGVDVYPNVDLGPESSHNVNLGPRVELRRPYIGRVTAEVSGFVREVSGQITQAFDAQDVATYQNAARVRALGVEGLLSWRSPGDWVVLDGNATWQDVRNTSTEGPFVKYNGDRIPNRPWLFANWSGRLQWRRVIMRDDELSPFYAGRYVHKFFYSWESLGTPRSEFTIPEQIAHDVGLSYSMRGPIRTSVTFEVDNLFNAQLYDFKGVQRPGRSVALKVSGEI
jgi:vitamin B12 transporter